MFSSDELAAEARQSLAAEGVPADHRRALVITGSKTKDGSELRLVGMVKVGERWEFHGIADWSSVSGLAAAGRVKWSGK